MCQGASLALPHQEPSDLDDTLPPGPNFCAVIDRTLELQCCEKGFFFWAVFARGWGFFYSAVVLNAWGGDEAGARTCAWDFLLALKWGFEGERRR